MSPDTEQDQIEQLADWRRRVALANGAGDTESLAELFDEVRALAGPERASHLWLQAMSAFDASAVTG